MPDFVPLPDALLLLELIDSLLPLPFFPADLEREALDFEPERPVALPAVLEADLVFLPVFLGGLLAVGTGGIFGLKTID